MMKSALVCLMLLYMLGFLPGAALAAEDAGRRAKVAEMLNGRQPLPKEGLKSLGDETGRVLMDIVADGREWPLTRARAVSQLTAFPTSETLAFLTALFDSKDDLAPLLKGKAIEVLQKGFGAQSLPALRKALDDPDILVREAALKATAALMGSAALPLLEERKKTEKIPLLQKTIDKLIRKVR